MQLLAGDIRHERNVILQCIRYVVQHYKLHTAAETSASSSELDNSASVGSTEKDSCIVEMPTSPEGRDLIEAANRGIVKDATEGDMLAVTSSGSDAGIPSEVIAMPGEKIAGIVSADGVEMPKDEITVPCSVDGTDVVIAAKESERSKASSSRIDTSNSKREEDPILSEAVEKLPEKLAPSSPNEDGSVVDALKETSFNVVEARALSEPVAAPKEKIGDALSPSVEGTDVDSGHGGSPTYL